MAGDCTMNSEKKWKVIFWIAFIIFILLISFWIVIAIENRNSSSISHCASAIQCTGDDLSKQKCHYFEDDGSVSEKTVICDRSGIIGDGN